MSREQVRTEEAGQAKSRPNGSNRPATGSEVLEALANEDAPPKKRVSFGAAVRDIVLVAGLLAGGTYFYYDHVVTKEKVAKIAQEASDFLRKDDLASLKKAEERYLSIIELDADNAAGLSALAELYYYQAEHGLDTRAKSEDFLRRAQAENAKTPEFISASAQIRISSGKATEVRDELKGMFEKGIYHAKLGNAYGEALLASGDYLQANQALKQAMDGAFNEVRIPMALAEVALRRGEERRAGNFFAKVLAKNLSPDHDLALPMYAALLAKTQGDILKAATALAEAQRIKGAMGSIGLAHLAWAEGELNLALNNGAEAQAKAEEAIKGIRDFPPFRSLLARALLAQGRRPDALAAYQEAAKLKPAYLASHWELAKLLSKDKDDGALDVIAAIENDIPPESRTTEFEIFRGEHYLRKGKITDAETAFKKAAELGSDPEILLGLTRVVFEQEKPKAKKADIEKVTVALEEALEAGDKRYRGNFPEGQLVLGEISIWNYLIESADEAFAKAEDQLKRMKKPTSEVLELYDRVIDVYDKAKDPQVAKKTAELKETWIKKRSDYVVSVRQQLL
ncbi:MAG: hypothetical protein HYV07_31520 [Deltaproteobacteria bacterium]|nr:hypothetical protein [Deltaproteobacteria bacterium]